MADDTNFIAQIRARAEEIQAEMSTYVSVAASMGLGDLSDSVQALATQAFRVQQAAKKALAAHRPPLPEPYGNAPAGTCPECDAGGPGPSHNGSQSCRCGSLASGGTRAHCTCDTCY